MQLSQQRLHVQTQRRQVQFVHRHEVGTLVAYVARVGDVLDFNPNLVALPEHAPELLPSTQANTHLHPLGPRQRRR